MVIIPGILGEAELRYFTDDTYAALSKLINVYIASKLNQYCQNPNADETIVLDIERNLRPKLNGILYNEKLDNKQLRSTVFNVHKVDIMNTEDTDKVLEDLQNVKDIVQNSESILNPRTSEDYNAFCTAFYAVINEMREDGAAFTYADPIKVFSANSFILYKPHEKEVTLRSHTYRTHRDTWTSASRAGEWKAYIEEHNVEGRLKL